MEDEDVLVSDEIRKDERTVIRVQVEEFKESYYFDIREWKDKGMYEGPTKKGVNMPLSRASNFGDTAKDVLEKHIKEWTSTSGKFRRKRWRKTSLV